MSETTRVLNVLNLLVSERLACPRDDTRLRYGDYECPHCGEDLEEYLTAFASRLVSEVCGDER